MIAGLETTTDGEIRIAGKRVNEVEPKDRNIAMVFQNYALYPHMSVYDNMAYGLKIRKFAKDDIERRVQRAAKILELGPYLQRKPRELSGGQRQRVAMGRAIVREPAAFLFDEPLSNLDAKLRVQMRLEIQKLHRELRTTSVYVTHDQVEAMTLANRMIVINAGVVEQIGAPLEVYDNPASLFVAGFIGSPSMNFMPGTARGRRRRRRRRARDPAAAGGPRQGGRAGDRGRAPRALRGGRGQRARLPAARGHGGVAGGGFAAARRLQRHAPRRAHRGALDAEGRHRARGLDPARQGVLLRYRHRQAARRLSPMALDARRLEELSLNSSAPPGQLLYDGWLLRFSPGKAKRARSVNAVYPSRLPVEEKIAHCERVYGEQGLPAIFRISEHTQPPSLDATLAARGYESFNPTEVHAAPVDPALARRARGGEPAPGGVVRHGGGPARLPRRPTAAPISRGWPRCRSPMRPVAVLEAGVPMATGLAIFEDAHVGLFDVVTREGARRRGFARTIVAALLRWGRERGARQAYLQVEEGNAPALALYGGFGFAPAYRYWYRGRPGETQ